MPASEPDDPTGPGQHIATTRPPEPPPDPDQDDPDAEDPLPGTPYTLVPPPLDLPYEQTLPDEPPTSHWGAPHHYGHGMQPDTPHLEQGDDPFAPPEPFDGSP